ncbi:hypothetical protein BH11ARM1_BH11ARM1_15610 [soil metagenome]
MNTQIAAPTVHSVWFEWSHDEVGEPDYLLRTPEDHYGKDGSNWSHVATSDIERVESEFGSIWNACVAYAKQDSQRLADFKSGDWGFEGCYAVAEISYDCSPGHYRLDRLQSAGLWGIESDSVGDYRRSVERDELADLSSHLSQFGISASVGELTKLF